MRGALPSGYPAHMRRRKACRIAPCARTVPEDRCSQSHTNTGLLRLLALCVTHLHRPRLSPARTSSLLRLPAPLSQAALIVPATPALLDIAMKCDSYHEHMRSSHWQQ